MSYSKLLKEIMYDEDNISYTERGIKPLFSAPETAKIIIIAQAPGIRAQELGIFFNDLSGDKLREWLGIDRECFYDSGYFAVVPMDYYFPGKGKTGDLPPRKGFAEKWHKKTLDLMPNKQLILLIGAYAQRYYLKQRSTEKLTNTVKNFDRYLPEFFPLVHPSPCNNIWQSKNPWFLDQVIPALQERVKAILK